MTFALTLPPGGCSPKEAAEFWETVPLVVSDRFENLLDGDRPRALTILRAASQSLTETSTSKTRDRESINSDNALGDIDSYLRFR
jgi:hypothetical protein